MSLLNVCRMMRHLMEMSRVIANLYKQEISAGKWPGFFCLTK